MRAQRDRGERPQLGRRVGPGGVEQLVLAAQALLERRQQAPFAVEPVVQVGVELVAHVPDRWAVTRAQHREVELAEAPQGFEVGGEVGGDEDAALAQHRVSDEGDAAGDEREVVIGVAGQREHAQRPEDVAVRRATAPGHDRHVAESRAERVEPFDVVLVVVRHRDPLCPAARRHLGGHGVEVGVERRAGIDDPAADHPRVRARERERARVVRADERDVVVREVPAQRGTSR